MATKEVKQTKGIKATKDIAVDVSSMSEQQLHEKLAKLRGEQNDMKRSHAAGELANPQTLNTNRKDIARVKTAMSQLMSKRNGKDEDNA